MNTADNFKLEIGCYKLLGLVARELPPVFDQFGKTAFQKSIYLMQELYGLGSGYDFEFYNYGTFSQDLAADLTTSEALGIIEVSSHQRSGVDITTGKEDISAGSFDEFPLPRGSLEAITQFKRDYPKTNRLEMEIDSTVVYVDRDLQRKGTTESLERFVEIVLSVKSHLNREQVTSAVQKLGARGFTLSGLAA